MTVHRAIGDAQNARFHGSTDFDTSHLRIIVGKLGGEVGVLGMVYKPWHYAVLT